MEKVNLIATTAFGLEAVCKREIAALGYNILYVSDGRIDFEGPLDAIAYANLCLRSADRVLLKVGEFTAKSFEELFQGVKALPWASLIPIDGKFTVIGKSVKSTLFSVPDCQAITKKAVVENLKQKYNVQWFEESGAEFKIQIALLKDIVTLTIDTTGAGLHKRGYRPTTSKAPIKETLAASLVLLSYWKKSRILLDPFCGSGTIAIEAAMIAKNIAPGYKRKFVSENWHWIDKKVWNNARTEIGRAVNKELTPQIYAYDIDPEAIKLARLCAKKAGVEESISFNTSDISRLSLPGDYGCLITNPPYGQRLGYDKETKSACEHLSRLIPKNSTWSMYIITSDTELQKRLNRKASTKRKLFNGNIKTDYYQFEGPKPPKSIINL